MRSAASNTPPPVCAHPLEHPLVKKVNSFNKVNKVNKVRNVSPFEVGPSPPLLCGSQGLT